MEYIGRICDSELAELIGTFGAVLVEGPKWCGKTTTAARQCSSELRVADPANGYRNRRLADVDPSVALSGPRPRLVDEWQEVPSVWDAVRYECDAAGGRPGQFVLTGSATPRDESAPVHSGAGRIGRLRMDTLTLQELGVSNGSVSLIDLFGGSKPRGVGKLVDDDVADLVCRGGWPAAVGLSTRSAQLVARSYIDAVISGDVPGETGSRNPAKLRRLVMSLARNEASLATRKALAHDTDAEGDRAIATKTVASYIDALERMFFVCDVPAWDPAVRSPVRIAAARKHHLADPSLAPAALGLSPSALLADRKFLGFLFESLVTHDLMVYARHMGASVFHYRDGDNLEVDLIVERNDGEWGAFEVKLGVGGEKQTEVKKAVSSIKALTRKMTAAGNRPPAVEAVVVGVGAVGCVSDDGVAVVPVDCLGA